MELGNPPALPPLSGSGWPKRPANARRGRSLRSSPRTGKPSTWRRRAVDTSCKQEMDNLSDAVNTGFILDMQRKLYRWSTADPDKRFADLFNIVCDRRTLFRAWQRLARNRGSNTPGTDRVTRTKVEERPDGVAGFLEDIRQDLRRGTYQPEPVRQRLIPKPGKPGQFRPLGIPTLKDRLVQMALKLVLEPIFEADFYPISYGFRPGRSTHDALARVRHRLNPTSAGPSRTRYVIEGDIKGCFDAIDHHVLMDRVRRRIRDRKVLRLVLAFLKADIMIEGNRRHPVTGTPQGGIISPLLANVYLTAIDERYRRWVPHPRDKTRVRAQQRLQSDYKRGRPGFLRGALRGRLRRPRAGNAAGCRARAPVAGGSSSKRTAHGVVDGKDQDHRCPGRLRLPGLSDRAGEDAVNRRHVGMLFIPKSKSQLLRDKIKVKVRGNAHRQNPRQPHRPPQSGHHGLAQLLPVRHKSISGVQPPRSLDMAARGALAENKARKSDVADAAPPLSSQRPGTTTAMDRRDQTPAVSL